MTIPKIIHQMWLDKNDKDLNKPPKQNYHKNIEDVQRLNEDYEYMWWNNSAVLEVFNHPKLTGYMDFYLNLAPHICKCDFARYAIMYRYGGFYFDLDFKFMNPIPEELLDNSVVFSHEPSFQPNYTKKRIHSITGLNTHLANNILISEACNDFWLGLMDEIVQFYVVHGMPMTLVAVVKTTGPKMISDHVESVLENGGIPGLKLLSDTSLFFGYPNIENAVSYNDWTDGTWWAVSQLTEFQEGQIALTFMTFVIILLILLAIVLIGLCIYRCNQKYTRSFGSDLLLSKGEQTGFRSWHRRPSYLPK